MKAESGSADAKLPLPPPVGRKRRGLAILDFLLRLLAIGATLSAAIAMGTNNETLKFFTQFFQFNARFYNLSAFIYFVIANATVGLYLLLSLPFSIFDIVRPRAAAFRVLLIFFDTVMVAVCTSGAAAATAIMYVARRGNTKTNWFSICQQFNSFCDQATGALGASFAAVVLLILLVLLSASTLHRQRADF
uniref:Casparian strip membrane protein 1 n=1 Tax=Pinus taeda TaxID=3352 RepID=CASP1_PINTA|nr:RecName: Full=Casparian strip membrane protein 1; Short=PtCASP1 [Pinus taeda]|eukprot:PITA_11088